MLVLAPVMCVLAGIGVNHVLTTYMQNLDVVTAKRKKGKKSDSNYPWKNEVRHKAVCMPSLNNGYMIFSVKYC